MSGKKKVAFAACALAAAGVGLFAIGLIQATAQTDFGFYQIYQSGKKVGEIYTPEREADATQYVEHWVLYKGYVYPKKGLTMVTEIRPTGQGYYSSAEDFLKRVPFGAGYRYVRIDATDTDTIPGR